MISKRSINSWHTSNHNCLNKGWYYICRPHQQHSSAGDTCTSTQVLLQSYTLLSYLETVCVMRQRRGAGEGSVACMCMWCLYRSSFTQVWVCMHVSSSSPTLVTVLVCVCIYPTHMPYMLACDMCGTIHSAVSCYCIKEIRTVESCL